MAALSTLFVVFGLTAITSSMTSKGTLRLTGTDLQVPQGILQRTRKIPFSAIRHVGLIEARGHRFLQVRSEGRKVSINRSWLPDGVFEQVCRILEEQTKTGQTGTASNEKVVPQHKSFGSRR